MVQTVALGLGALAALVLVVVAGFELFRAVRGPVVVTRSLAGKHAKERGLFMSLKAANPHQPCFHPRCLTDNVVVECADCDEQWSAVTMDWPRNPAGLCMVRTGVGWGPRCDVCHAKFKTAGRAGLRYCPVCDVDRRAA